MRRLGLALIFALFVAMALGACGDDDDSSSGDGNGGATASEPAAELSGDPVKVMMINPYENPILDWYMANTGAEAAADAINADGGINGRPIEIIPCNERVDPNRAARCARQAEQDGATAVIVNSLFPQQIFPILDAAGIPNVGGFVTEPEDTQSAMAYPIVPGTNLLNNVWPGVLADQGNDRIGGIVEGRASTVTDVEVMEAGAEAAGIEFAGAVGVPAETTDLSPKIQELKELEADAVIGLLAPSLLTQVLQAMGDFGYTEPLATTAWTVFPSMLSELGDRTDGLLTLDQLPPASAGDEFPAIAQFNEEMDAAGADGENDRTIQAIQAWLAVHAIALVGEKVQGELNNETMVAELDKGEPVDLMGLLEWTPAAAGPGDYERLSNGNLYLSEVQDGELTIVEPEPFNGFEIAGLE